MNVRDEFEEEYPGILEKISENIFDNGTHPDIEITNHFYNNAIESEGHVYFSDKNGKEIGLAFRSGDRDGFEVLSYGDDFEIPKKMYRKLTFVLNDEYKNNKKAQMIFNSKKKEHQKKASEMAYDLHFSPTDKIQKYYDEYMKKWKLRCDVEMIEED